MNESIAMQRTELLFLASYMLSSQPCHRQFIHGWEWAGVGGGTLKTTTPTNRREQSWERYRATEGRSKVFIGWKEGLNLTK